MLKSLILPLNFPKIVSFSTKWANNFQQFFDNLKFRGGEIAPFTPLPLATTTLPSSTTLPPAFRGYRRHCSPASVSTLLALFFLFPFRLPVGQGFFP